MEDKLHTKQSVHLLELPTFPKGVLSLGIPAVSAALSDKFEVHVIDLNTHSIDFDFSRHNLATSLFIGLKVSSQNYTIAIAVTKRIKAAFPNTPIVWGGEYPTLMPSDAIKYADMVVKGAFEPVVRNLTEDIQNNLRGKTYDGRSNSYTSNLNPTDVKIMGNLNKYFQFMGMPVETSKGCDKKCTFCMVHDMQPTYESIELTKLQTELDNYSGRFLNVVDYNIGVNKQHFINVANKIRKSTVLGWMAETCIESLDDDDLLQSLSDSRCKMIYCGLESIDEGSLKSVNKSKTNQIENYERIIRKVQSYGIQVAAGLILGLEGTDKNTFKRTYNQFEKWGIIYTKLTFLTYNPGSKVKESMRKKGQYITETIDHFDGNHLTFLANGLDKNILYDGAKEFIKNFYSIASIIKRSKVSKLRGWHRLEFILFNFCYSDVYKKWIKHDVFKSEKGFNALLIQPFKKSLSISLFDWLITYVRRKIYHSQK